MATDGTPPGAAASPRGARAFPLVAGVLLLIQAFICFQGLGDQWTRGHNGFNGAAYHLAARNSVRWGDLFPVQYLTGRTPPTPADYYTHHPLAMHLHNVASLSLFGDTEASIRLVPAVHSILALVALLLFVRRFWGPATAMVAGAIYVALPTNGIYANMMNHPAGCIFWCILAFWCYLRFREERDCDRGDGAGAPPRVGVGAAQRDRACTGGAPARWGRFYAGMLGAFVMATSWEWPAYYAAFFIGLHWLVVAIARRVRDPGPGAWRRLFGEFALLAGFGVWILVQFVGFFLLVRLLVGNLHELTGTISSRQAIGWGRFAYTLRVVPALMFTWPVLAICAFWLARTLVRLVRGRFEHRDLVPLSFAIGGWVHYFVFKWSTIVHEYWLWTTLPFAAIACATVLAGAQRFVRDRLAPPALRLVCDRLAPAALRLVRDRLAPPALRLVRDRLA
ncbi:MAG: glycosyltransferase family 39 protein, partial [Deltaproteobacteria bacterium]|nr:glycosyltransferase family 39 protein [Deltaproteobacteria bacterium]